MEVNVAVLLIILPVVLRTLFVPFEHIRGMGRRSPCYFVRHTRLGSAWLQAVLRASGGRGVPQCHYWLPGTMALMAMVCRDGTEVFEVRQLVKSNGW